MYYPRDVVYVCGQPIFAVNVLTCFLEMLMKTVTSQLLHGGLHKLNWPSFCCPDLWTVLTTGKAFARDSTILVVISPYLWLSD